MTYVEGAVADGTLLSQAALVNFGHFSTMRVRRRAAQGLDLHLRRLDEANRSLFGVPLAPGRVRREVLAAFDAAGFDDGMLRITVAAPGHDPGGIDACAGVVLLVTLSPPREPASRPVRIKSWQHERVMPAIKHVGTFPLLWYQRQSKRQGYDDALFVDGRRRVLEGSVWNIGFWDGEQVVWPQAPALRGVTERLLQSGLERSGVLQTARTLHLDDVSGFRAAFTANARGLQAIRSIDEHCFDVDPNGIEVLAQVLAGQPWQAFDEAGGAD